MNDPDLLAVRTLAPEPTDESVSRSWYRIMQLEAKRQRPQRLRWLKPVIAAFAVVALAAASVTLVRVGPGTLWPVASTPETIDVLHALADTAEHGSPAPQLGPGQLIRRKSEGWAGECSPTTCTLKPQPREIWHDPQLGMLAVKILAGDSQMLPDQRDDPSGEATQMRRILQEQGPSIHFPTPQWLAGLPLDTADLLSRLRTETEENANWTVDHQLWDAMAQVYSSCEILMSPQLRAALLRSFTGMSGLSVRHVTVDGRNLVAIRHTDGGSGNEIIFDPMTGQAVGRGSSSSGGVTIVQPVNGPILDPGVLYQTTWEQSIVDAL